MGQLRQAQYRLTSGAYTVNALDMAVHVSGKAADILRRKASFCSGSMLMTRDITPTLHQAKQRLPWWSQQRFLAVLDRLTHSSTTFTTEWDGFGEDWAIIVEAGATVATLRVDAPLKRV
jgi:hypothetical protein